MKRFCILLVISFLFLACNEKEAPHTIQEPGSLLENYNKHPLRNQTFWQPYFDYPFIERVFAAPPELVDYIALDNQVNGFPEIPRQVVLDPQLKEDIQAALRELPSQVRLLVSHKFAGIFIIEGLGSSGYTEGFYDNDQDAWGGYIVLDRDALNKSVNEWATWKENTPFIQDGTHKISMRMQRSRNNDRVHALLYILLHEFGHIYSIDKGIHPMWHEGGNDIQNTGVYPFLTLSWKIRNKSEKYVTSFGEVFPLREKIVYYVGPKLKASQMVEVYDQLEKTNFVTLYAATNPFDDFAESFASYIHTQLLGKPWSIWIYENNAVIKRYENPWNHPRMAPKKLFFDNIFLDTHLDN